MSHNQPSPTPDPDWVNASDFIGDGNYGSKHVVTAVEDDKFVISTGPGNAYFTLIFGAVFATSVAALLLWGLADWHPTARMVISLSAGAFACFGVAVAVAIEESDRRRGDYLVADRRLQSVSLPRLKREFAWEDVVALQWITGSAPLADAPNESDLNLLVSEGSRTLRYQVLANPPADCVKRLARFSGFDLRRIDVGRKGDRYADAPG